MAERTYGAPERQASEDGYCASREDGQHCVHWWDGETCCSCGAAAMTEAQNRTRGMR